MAIVNSFHIDGIDHISFVLNEDADFPEEGPKFWVDAEYLSPFALASASADTHEEATDGALLDLANVLWKMHQSVSLEYARRLRAKSELSSVE